MRSLNCRNKERCYALRWRQTVKKTLGLVDKWAKKYLLQLEMNQDDIGRNSILQPPHHGAVVLHEQKRSI